MLFLFTLALNTKEDFDINFVNFLSDQICVWPRYVQSSICGIFSETKKYASPEVSVGVQLFLMKIGSGFQDVVDQAKFCRVPKDFVVNMALPSRLIGFLRIC